MTRVPFLSKMVYKSVRVWTSGQSFLAWNCVEGFPSFFLHLRELSRINRLYCEYLAAPVVTVFGLNFVFPIFFKGNYSDSLRDAKDATDIRPSSLKAITTGDFYTYISLLGLP